MYGTHWSSAATDYDVESLKTRRRGRPAMGSGPAEVVPVRIDPELKAAIESRAEADHTTISEIIRSALRKFLDVAGPQQSCSSGRALSLR